MAQFRDYAVNDSTFFYQNGMELRNTYFTQEGDTLPKEGDLTADIQRELIHGYYACISYIDAQTGRIIETLKAEGLYDNTIIVFLGDHGFHLGDHNMWCKHTNFEQSTHSPLLIKSPNSIANNVVTSPTGHIDIYPTLCDLAGFDIPEDKDGKSLVPLLTDPDARVNDFTVHRYNSWGGKHYDGNGMRNDRYRLVEWTLNGDTAYQLFDYEEDSLESVNIASLPENFTRVGEMKSQLHSYLSALNTQTQAMVVANLSAGEEGFGFTNNGELTQQEGLNVWLGADAINTKNWINSGSQKWYYNPIKSGDVGSSYLVFPPINTSDFESLKLAINYFNNGEYENVGSCTYFCSINNDAENSFTGNYDLSEWDTLGSTALFTGLSAENEAFSIPSKYDDTENVRILVKLKIDDASAITATTYYKINSIKIIGEKKDISNALNEQSTMPSIKPLYPNPTDGLIYVPMGNDMQSDFELYDTSGKKIMQGVLGANEEDMIDMSGYGEGIYYLTMVVDEKEIVTQKIINR